MGKKQKQKRTDLWSKAMISKVNSDKWSFGPEKKTLEIWFLVIAVWKKKKHIEVSLSLITHRHQWSGFIEETIACHRN